MWALLSEVQRPGSEAGHSSALDAGLRTLDSLSPTVARAVIHTIFVELAVEVQPLEDELDGRGDARRVILHAELGHRALDADRRRGLQHVLHGGHGIADLDVQPSLEGMNQLVELLHA